MNLNIGQSINHLNNSGLLLFPVFLIVSFSWLALRSLLNKQVSLRKLENNFLEIKRNPQFFLPLYESLDVLNDQLLTKEYPFIIGNDTAPITITLVIDPLNESSRICYTEIENLLTLFPSQINLRIVFRIADSKNRSLSQSLALWLYSAYTVNKQTGRRFLQEILTSQNTPVEKQYNYLQASSSYHLSFIKIHEQWCAQNKISQTPTILINNRIYPFVFDKTDLKEYITKYYTNPEILINYSKKIS